MLIADRPSWFDNIPAIAAKIPSVNSYMAHDHVFARSLRAAFRDKEYLLETCVGLNRFWFQIGATFSAPSKREHPDHRAAWDEAVAFCEAGTRKLIDIINPRSVALIGKPAANAVPEHFRVRRNAFVFKDCTYPARGGEGLFERELAELIKQTGIERGSAP